MYRDNIGGPENSEWCGASVVVGRAAASLPPLIIWTISRLPALHAAPTQQCLRAAFHQPSVSHNSQVPISTSISPRISPIYISPNLLSVPFI